MYDTNKAAAKRRIKEAAGMAEAKQLVKQVQPRHHSQTRPEIYCVI